MGAGGSAAIIGFDELCNGSHFEAWKCEALAEKNGSQQNWFDLLQRFPAFILEVAFLEMIYPHSQATV